MDVDKIAGRVAASVLRVGEKQLPKAYTSGGRRYIPMLVEVTISVDAEVETGRGDDYEYEAQQTFLQKFPDGMSWGKMKVQVEGVEVVKGLVDKSGMTVN